MVQSARTNGRVKSGDGTRARILAAATELFASKGFEGTTVRAIAARCQVTDPALYHYFDSKRDILRALWEEMPATVPAGLREPITRESIAEYIEAASQTWCRHCSLLRVMLQQAIERDPGAIELRRRAMAAYRASLVPALEQVYGRRANLIADATVFALLGLQLDSMLRHGAAFRDVATEPAFRARVRRLIEQVLPCP